MDKLRTYTIVQKGGSACSAMSSSPSVCNCELHTYLRLLNSPSAHLKSDFDQDKFPNIKRLLEGLKRENEMNQREGNIIAEFYDREKLVGRVEV